MTEPTEKNGNLSIMEVFQSLKETGNFDFTPCSTVPDFEDRTRFSKLEMSPAQKMHFSTFMQQVPTVLASGTLAQAYTVSFPAGIPHTLTALQQGGFGSMVRDGGRFVGSASFSPIQTQAVLLGAFSAMSVITGQYFLTQINQSMDKMNLKLDKILEFLYGDKKAELLSEIDFTKYAFDNYLSIMHHEQQRLATITNLQAAKKVAMKDIEFYMADLFSAVNGTTRNYVDQALQIRDSLDLSIQLYIMSTLLEVYFAQNYDVMYLSSVERDVCSYIDKCEKRVLSSFSVLNRRFDERKGQKKKMRNSDLGFNQKKDIELLVDSLISGEESSLCKSVRNALHAVEKASEYYIDGQQNIYLKLN